MIWTGRFDGDDPLCHRIFQRVETAEDYSAVQPGDFVLHGFASDEGVRRNNGRPGAREAPDVLRRSLANFPVTYPEFSLKDFGDIICEDTNLEKAQTELSQKVNQVLRKGGRSLVFGGGHEVMYAHFKGLRAAFPQKKIGIINIDAHFDNREPQKGLPTSGTGFWQIAQEEKIHSLHLGIQRNSNTLKLFDTAHRYGMKYLLAEEIFYENLTHVFTVLDEFCAQTEVLYLTVCMDAFSSAVAPGVSAPAYNGLLPDAAFMRLFHRILKNEKMRAMDIAEINPVYDQDFRTARFAASLVNDWLQMPG